MSLALRRRAENDAGPRPALSRTAVVFSGAGRV